MSKFIKYLVCFFCCLLFLVKVNAFSLETPTYVQSYDDVGIYDVGAFVNKNFSLNNKNITVQLPDGFEFVYLCGRTKTNDGTDNIIEEETCKSNGGKYWGYTIVSGVKKSLVYTKISNLMNGDTPSTSLVDISGEIVLTFPDAVTLKNGENANIIMTINNIKMKINKKTNSPLLVLKQDGTDDVPKMAVVAEANDASFSGSYDMAFKLTRKDGSIVNNDTLGIIFSDLDVWHEKYPESVQLMWGIKGNNVYRRTVENPNQYLNISPDNTKYTTTKSNTDNGGLTGDKSNFAGFAVIVDSGGFKYNWTGTECGTSIDFITVNPGTGNVSKVIMVFVLLGVSCLVMFIFSRKLNKFN